MATPFDGIVPMDAYGVVDPASVMQAPAAPAAVPGPAPMPQVPGITMYQEPPPGADPLPTFGMAPQQAPAGGPGQLGPYSWDTIERAIDNIESGGRADRVGRYDQLGPVITNRNSAYFGDRAYGRFQFMGKDIPELTRQFYGTALTPQQFLQNHEAQHAVFRGRFAQHYAQFGNATDAAQAHFAGAGSVGAPGAMDRNDAQAGFRGTTVRNYRRMFESGLSRFAGAGGQPEFTPSTLEMSPDMASALGLPSTSMPAPGSLSPRGAAMVPGLQAAPGAAPGAPGAPGPTYFPPGVGQGGNAAIGQALPFGDLWANMGARPSGLTQLSSFMAQAPAAEQAAAMQIFTRGQQLQMENPGATPQQIAQLLMRDPVVGRAGMFVGRHGPAIIQAAIQPPQGPPTFQGFSPGQQIFRNDGGQLSPTDMSVPATLPPDMQMLQHIQAMPPEQQAGAIALMERLRGARSVPSDREQAWARLQAQDPATYTNEMRDRWLAGLIRPEPVLGPTGQVIGQRWIDTVTGQAVTMGPDRRPGVAPTPTVAPGAGAGGPPGTPVTPPAGGPPGGPPTMTSAPRVIGRRGDGREVKDVPELALSTSLLANPAEMTLGAGPVAGFLGAWGRIVGNLAPGTEEEVLARQSLMDQFRASYTQYVQSTKLKSEHEAAMAAIPTSGEIFTNPLRAVNQFIGLREGLIRELELALQQSGDQNRDPATRREADKRISEIQNVLLRMPSQQGLYELAGRLRSGEHIAGTQPSEAIERAGEAASAVTGGRLLGQGAPPSALPPDLSSLDLPALRRLSVRPNLTQGDRQKLIDAITILQTGRPPVPRSY